MIIGNGIDIIDIDRIRRVIDKYGNRFKKRCFSISEIERSEKRLNSIESYAKRYAAKEALSKALGTGFRNSLNFKDIEILNDKIGKPHYLKSKKITNIISKKFKTKRYNLFLSITDEKDYSIAFTILQSQ